MLPRDTGGLIRPTFGRGTFEADHFTPHYLGLKLTQRDSLLHSSSIPRVRIVTSGATRVVVESHLRIYIENLI
jgi:hypothetical protein